MLKNKRSLMVIKAIVRLLIALIVFFLIVIPACNKIRGIFFGQDAAKPGQIVGGLLEPVDGKACLLNFNKNHKAVDIRADCGTDVRAACGGRLESAGPGLSGDSVFGGTSSGGEEGLLLDNLQNCASGSKDWSDYRIFYGCIDFNNRLSRDVEQGDVIGTVGQCEKNSKEMSGCHLHFVLVEGALGGDGSTSACEYSPTAS